MIEINALQDESSHWYLVPNRLKDKFFELNEKAQMGDPKAEQLFIETFSVYEIGGNINNIQLYINL